MLSVHKTSTCTRASELLLKFSLDPLCNANLGPWPGGNMFRKKTGGGRDKDKVLTQEASSLVPGQVRPGVHASVSSHGM